nr:hypothetical protein [Tanacetum cinerariifolium]
MPSKLNDPLDPLLDELYSLTKMTSAKEIRDASLNATKVKVMKGVVRELKIPMLTIRLIRNDGSFICISCDKSPFLDDKCKPVAKSSGLINGLDPTCMGDVGSMSCDQTYSKDGIAIAEIGSGIDVDMAGPSDRDKLASMEEVVGTGLVSSNPMDGIASDKGGDKFEFGKISSSKGILNKPNKPMFTVNFVPNVKMSNPFMERPAGSSAWNAWGSNEGSSFGPTILSNQFLVDAEKFAEKLKKGSEEVALKMEYVPSAISKTENGNKRIMFSAEEVIKGGQVCTLQLYGYFVGTSMDYHVVRGNLMRMWRVYDIEEITKTNSGIFYFKFKSEEGMKFVLESGP